jgi:ubiquitin carboxyl-terminal hydrolase 14
LTHKGRSADSGHYVGWVKQDDGQINCVLLFSRYISRIEYFWHYKDTDSSMLPFSGKWIEFDDDNPSIRKEEEILKLSGGGEQLF